MSADHSNKKRKIFEEPTSPLPSSPLTSSPLSISPLSSSPLRASLVDLAQTTNSYESSYYDTDNEFVSA
jgi:hypothetical protein